MESFSDRLENITDPGELMEMKHQLFRESVRIQAERAQIDPVFRGLQGFDRVVRLAGVGRTDMQDKAPLHFPRKRKKVDIVVRDSGQKFVFKFLSFLFAHVYKRSAGAVPAGMRQDAVRFLS